MWSSLSFDMLNIVTPRGKRGQIRGVWMRTNERGGVWVITASTYLEFICIIEADLHRRDHPGLKQGTQDTIGYSVSDEMEVKGVSPDKKNIQTLICVSHPSRFCTWFKKIMAMIKPWPWRYCSSIIGYTRQKQHCNHGNLNHHVFT